MKIGGVLLAASLVFATALPATAGVGVPTPAQCEEFALACEDAVNTENFQFFNETTDLTNFLATVIQDYPDPQGDQAEFSRGFCRSFQEAGLARALEYALQGSSTYTYLRTLDIEGTPNLLFRMNGDQGFNYHQFPLGLDDNGQVRILDLFSFATGENASTTFREIYNQGMAGQVGFTNKLLGKSQKQLEAANRVAEARELMAAGDYRAAYAKLDFDLSASFDVPAVFLFRLTCAAQFDQELYMKAMVEFGQKFPDSPAWLLLALDFELQQGHHQAALKAIEKLDRRIGGDPLLDVYRANVMADKGDYRQGLILAQAAKEAEPELEDAYWSIVAIALAQEDFPSVASELTTLSSLFGYQFDPELLAADETYGPFCASPAGLAWAAVQP